MTIHPTGGGRMARTTPATEPANLADVLDRVLDKGLVIAGDIRVNLLDVELLTIKLRLLIASVDKAKEMGIDWWERDESLTGRPDAGSRRRLDDGMRDINERLDRLERMLRSSAPGASGVTGARAGAEVRPGSDPAAPPSAPGPPSGPARPSGPAPGPADRSGHGD